MVVLPATFLTLITGTLTVLGRLTRILAFFLKKFAIVTKSLKVAKRFLSNNDLTLHLKKKYFNFVIRSFDYHT